MLLGDRHEARGTVDLARRSMYHSPHSQLTRRLENVERAFNVRIDVGIGRVIRIRDRNERREVEDRPASSHCFPDSVRIPDVAGEDVDAVANALWRVIQPTPRVE